MREVHNLQKSALFCDLVRCIPSLPSMRRILLDALLFVVLWVGISILSDTPYPFHFPPIPSVCIVFPVFSSESSLLLPLEESQFPVVNTESPIVETTPTIQEDSRLNATSSYGFVDSSSIASRSFPLVLSPFPASRNDSEEIQTEMPLRTTAPPFPSEMANTARLSSNDTYGYPKDLCDVVMTLSAECSGVALYPTNHLVVIHP